MTILYLWPDQVRQLQENASQLRAIYAGEKADTILVREQEVMRAWKELLMACEGSRVQVTTVTDKIQFFAMVRELSMWTDGIMGQIGPVDDPRYELSHSQTHTVLSSYFDLITFLQAWCTKPWLPSFCQALLIKCLYMKRESNKLI